MSLVRIICRRVFKKFENIAYLTRDEAEGEDTQGCAYKSLEEMWALELTGSRGHNQTEWYQQGNQYWSSLQPNLANVLGGSSDINEPDLKESSIFIDSIISKYRIPNLSALDCGAGIGRITKHLLIQRFSSVDLVDQCEKFIEYSKTYVNSTKARNFYTQGLQSLNIPYEYNLIWIQWVLSQLTDEDLPRFLKKIEQNLSANGVIIIKENVKNKGFLLHKDDFSVTRSEKMIKHAIEKSGLKIIEEKYQDDWPKDLVELKMFACVPG